MRARWPPRFIFLLGALILPAQAVNAAPQNPAPEPVIRVDVNLVRIPTRVIDKSGVPVGTLRESDFQIFENGVEQKLAKFGQRSEPLHVAIVVDTSTSTSRHMQTLMDVAQDFYSRFGPEDYLAIYEAGPEVVRLAAFTRERDSLAKTLRALRTADALESKSKVLARGGKVLKKNPGKGGTLLYDALMLVRQEFPPDATRRFLIVLTDAVDAGSQTAFASLQRTFLQGNEHIFAMIVKTPAQQVPGFVSRSLALRRQPERGPQNWTVAFDMLGASPETLRDYERVARGFLNELSDQDRVQLVTVEPKDLAVFPLAQTRGGNAPVPAAEALPGLPNLWKSRRERDSGPALKKIGNCDKVLLLTDANHSGLRGLTRKVPSNVPVAILAPEKMKNEGDARATLQTLTQDPNGVQKVMAVQSDLRLEELLREFPKLAVDSGGNAFEIQKESDLEGIYLTIAEQIRMTYALAYYTQAHSGLHEIQVKVKNPDLRVYARRALVLCNNDPDSMWGQEKKGEAGSPPCNTAPAKKQPN